MCERVSILGRNAVLGHKVHLRHDFITDKACTLPTHFVMARRKAVLVDSHFSFACARGSNGGEHRVSSTNSKSHAGALRAFGGCSRRAPLRKRDTSLWLPTVLPSTLGCCPEIAATYTYKVDGDQPVSRRDCRKSRITGTGHRTGSLS